MARGVVLFGLEDEEADVSVKRGLKGQTIRLRVANTATTHHIDFVYHQADIEELLQARLIPFISNVSALLGPAIVACFDDELTTAKATFSLVLKRFLIHLNASDENHSLKVAAVSVSKFNNHHFDLFDPQRTAGVTRKQLDSSGDIATFLEKVSSNLNLADGEFKRQLTMFVCETINQRIIFCYVPFNVTATLGVVEGLKEDEQLDILSQLYDPTNNAILKTNYLSILSTLNYKSKFNKGQLLHLVAINTDSLDGVTGRRALFPGSSEVLVDVESESSEEGDATELLGFLSGLNPVGKADMEVLRGAPQRQRSQVRPEQLDEYPQTGRSNRSRPRPQPSSIRHSYNHNTRAEYREDDTSELSGSESGFEEESREYERNRREKATFEAVSAQLSSETFGGPSPAEAKHIKELEQQLRRVMQTRDEVQGRLAQQKAMHTSETKNLFKVHSRALTALSTSHAETILKLRKELLNTSRGN